MARDFLSIRRGICRILDLLIEILQINVQLNDRIMQTYNIYKKIVSIKRYLNSINLHYPIIIAHYPMIHLSKHRK
jgi:hypothetical protein